ncbi:carbohydrate ABC transporter permease [Deinococcus roseus]|uniref:Sugar ABC transporter permease n=1 Tax=Deinococcus roseus TaxID=392414 RepID=A0ABQ2D6N9_9DEIO|nr:carbohydrate ABC transporter permease [Deinococcus roseus]GGJ47339.1 sugar ABC transporter permease [Deinococcus roseus]
MTRAMTPPRNPKTTRRVSRILMYVLLVVLAICMSLPMIYTLSTAFKGTVFVFEYPPQFIPKEPTFANFVNAWQSNNFGHYFLNSMFTASMTTIGTVAIAATGAYAFARLNFPLKNVFFWTYLLFMMIPGMLYIIPQFLIAKKLHLLNSLMGLVVFYVAGSVPFHTFLLRGFFQSIPGEIEEAAQMDGASRWQVFTRIALPLAMPALGTSAIFAFLGSWDEFTLALTFINDENLRTLPIAIRLFQGQHTAQWGLIFAASLIAMVPVVVAYVGFQNLFIKTVNEGGVKT